VREGARVALVDRDAEALAALRTRLADGRRHGRRVRTDVGGRKRPCRRPSRVRSRRSVRSRRRHERRNLSIRGHAAGAGVDARDLRADAAREPGRHVLGREVRAPALLAHGGAIVTIASTAALRATDYGSGYTAAKGGVVALTRLLAEHTARRAYDELRCPGRRHADDRRAYHNPRWSSACGADPGRAASPSLTRSATSRAPPLDARST